MTLTGMLTFSGTAFSASDVSNNTALSNQASGSVASSVASSQASSIISSAATGGFSTGGGVGGFSPSGGNGGFSPGGGSGGFSPGGDSSGAPHSSIDDGKPEQHAQINTRIFGENAGDEDNRFGMWAQGLWANVDKTEADLQMKGNVYNLMGGIDRRVNALLLLGLAAGYENIDFATVYNKGTYKDQGETLSPYLAITLTPQWTLDSAAGYTWIDYQTSSQGGATSASFAGHRLSASGNLTGSYAYEQWRFQPKVGALYALESQNAYRNNSGTQVNSDAFALGRVTGGGKVGYDFGIALPYIKAQAEWDFRTPDSVLKSDLQYSVIDHGGGLAGLGVEVSRGDFVGSIEADYNSIGRTDLEVWSIIARLHYAF